MRVRAAFMVGNRDVQSHWLEAASGRIICKAEQSGYPYRRAQNQINQCHWSLLLFGPPLRRSLRDGGQRLYELEVKTLTKHEASVLAAFSGLDWREKSHQVPYLITQQLKSFSLYWQRTPT